jgi:deoxyribonuclease IV
VGVRIGAHVSTSGGVHTSISRAVEIGANCIQIFAGAPQRWMEARFSDEDVETFRRLSRVNDIRPVFVHSSYLINMASLDDALRARSVGSLVAGLRWAEKLGASGVITHLGSSRDAVPELAMGLVVQSLATVLVEAPIGPHLLLETCAGQGNTIGRRFEQIGEVIDRLDRDPRLQVCLDTAHIFAAGYDITTRDGLSSTLRQFDELIGLDRLAAIHVNDSKSPFASNVDRHENIGKGLIGEDALALVLNHPHLRHIPFLLEVPGFDGQGPDRQNVLALRRLAGLEPESD